MQRMFQSATLKLTAWYLALIMCVSITFSVVIYSLNYREISFRLESLQHSLIDEIFLYTPLRSQPMNGPGSPLFKQAQQASSQMVASLVYINLIIFLAGGLGSFFLARRTLRPIATAHEAQSRFTSDASHELRTPLAAMKAELEVSLRDPKMTMGEARELLESNLEEVNKLIALSEMLLNLSRLDHGKLEMEAVDAVTLTQSVLEQYPESTKRFEVTTRKKATARANEAAYREAITILMDNALKYSPPKTPIKVRIFEQRGQVAIEIINSGPAIPAEKLPFIFDRFVRADTSRTGGSQKGYGLGLSIAKKIVDVHHGSVTVSSTAEATKFTLYIPIYRKIKA